MVSKLPSLGNLLPDMGIMLATAGSALAKLVNPFAGRGQFRWRSWSVGLANVGRWLAVCNDGPRKGEWRDDASSRVPRKASFADGRGS